MDENYAPLSYADEQAIEQWEQVRGIVDDLRDRFSTSRPLPPPKPGSALREDDRRCAPLQPSHAVSQTLLAAVDHLHAAQALVFDTGWLHPYAGMTLLRSAIESAAVSHWLMHPAARRERISRALRWSLADAKDQRNAYVAVGIDPSDYDVIPLVHDVAARNGIARAELSRPRWTYSEPVKYATYTGLPTFVMWQRASAYAHGRRWVALSSTNRVATAAEGVEGQIAPTTTLNTRIWTTPVDLWTNFRCVLALATSAIDLVEKRGTPPT